MNFKLDYPGRSFVRVSPDPANPGAILEVRGRAGQVAAFVLSPERAVELGRALMEHHVRQDDCDRSCPLCGEEPA
jgi:hypothetical protein